MFQDIWNKRAHLHAVLRYTIIILHELHLEKMHDERRDPIAVFLLSACKIFQYEKDWDPTKQNSLRG